MPSQSFLRFPVIFRGAEYLVMGYLMHRNILAYPAPPNNEGYDLICIHPNPRHRPKGKEVALVRVQVKSRYATDCDRGFPVKEASLDAFVFLVVSFLNIGNFVRGGTDLTGLREPEFYTLSNKFIGKHHETSGGWQKVRLCNLQNRIERFKNEAGFELIAKKHGIDPPSRPIVC